MTDEIGAGETDDTIPGEGGDVPDERASKAVVQARQMISPRLLRITVDGITSAFASTGHADEFVTLRLPGPDGAPVVRYYSVRAWRPESGELDIEFVLHGHGPAAAWAHRARPGDRLEVGAPHGYYDPPDTARRIVLAGDATALPAIARILDERPTGGPSATVLVSVIQEADRIQLPLSSGDSMRWFADSADLVSATIAASTDAATGEDATSGSAYIWFSGEASDMRAVRRHVRRTLALPTRDWATMAYWRHDSERWHARFESHGPELRKQFEGIYATDDDPELQRDHADELFTRYGL